MKNLKLLLTNNVLEFKALLSQRGTIFFKKNKIDDHIKGWSFQERDDVSFKKRK